jgi:hypothetical protein
MVTETWTLTKRNKSKIQEMDMKFLRSIEEERRDRRWNPKFVMRIRREWIGEGYRERH